MLQPFQKPPKNVMPYHGQQQVHEHHPEVMQNAGMEHHSPAVSNSPLPPNMMSPPQVHSMGQGPQPHMGHLGPSPWLGMRKSMEAQVPGIGGPGSGKMKEPFDHPAGPPKPWPYRGNVPV